MEGITHKPVIEDALCGPCGAPLAAGLKLPGVDLSGVWLGLDFLRRQSLGPEPRLDDPVVVLDQEVA